MKYLVEVGGTAHSVQLERQGQTITAQVDDRKYHIEMLPLADGGFLLLENGRVVECRIGSVPGQRDQVRVGIGPSEYEFTVRDPRRLTSNASGAANDGAAQLISMMPGKIVRVLAELGHEVAANEPVLVVEAMKMQNELKSPRAGVIREIRVATGDTVNGGDVLAVIE